MNRGVSVRSTWFSACVLLACSGLAASQGTDRQPLYTGSKTCAECHSSEAQAWRGSHHELAWTIPDENTLLGDFNSATSMHRSETANFRKENDTFLVETQNGEEPPKRFRIVGVAGIEPLQQVLVEFGDGRIQAVDFAWDVDRRQWFHLYPDQDLPPDDGLHWTGPYKNWNARCAECHATGYEKNYNPRNRGYSSSQAEIGVGCEACHGPGEAHLSWAKNPQSFSADSWNNIGEQGLTINFSADAPETEIQQCAGCHSRRESLTGQSPLPGTRFHDAYRLALLRNNLYHADGSILDEVYVYGSFLQSKMYGKGVRCSDCHDPHAARLKADGNGICTQCHSPAGNSRFPSLRPAEYDTPDHHFHDVGTEGAQCKSCHMIERVYMQIDWRRDHSFRIPRPDLSDETGAPNACNDCHADKTAVWAAAEIEKRFPDEANRQPHFSQVFARARVDAAGMSEALMDVAEHDGLPGIVRATALDLVRSAPDPAAATRAIPLLIDSDPLVRAAAVAVQRGADPAERIQRLLPVLNDPVRSVRIAAAREFLDAPIAQMPPRMAAAVNAVMGEWQASLLANSDFPETQMAIGGAALVFRNVQAAEQAFREAVRLDPQEVNAWAMIIRIKAATGDRDGAAGAAEEALAANPGDPALQALSAELGGSAQ